MCVYVWVCVLKCKYSLEDTGFPEAAVIGCMGADEGAGNWIQVRSRPVSAYNGWATSLV